jgi:hypothetical protein
MAKIARLNRIQEADKRRAYLMLVPKSLFEKFQINPETGLNKKGEQCVFIDAPESGSEASVKVMRSPTDRDQLYYMEVRDSRDLVQLFWDFILINDPESPRFDTDVTPEGGSRWLNWKRRNAKEEKKALEAGMSPGQVRRGMKLTGEVNECLDDFCRAVGFKSIALEALFYHNAIQYEKHGFRYFSDEQVMRDIHEAFQPGGVLYERLDGSTFRPAWAADSIRGRSWTIHSDILEEVWEQGFDSWKPPKMYRMAGKRFDINTVPGVKY